jgi:hypothetical protein
VGRGAPRLLTPVPPPPGPLLPPQLGQHIGQLDHLLPEPYVVTMRNNLLDKCPISSWAEVRRTITKDLGQPPEQLFASFEQQPIASASLAQVGCARVRPAGAAPRCAAAGAREGERGGARGGKVCSRGAGQAGDST